MESAENIWMPDMTTLDRVSKVARLPCVLKVAESSPETRENNYLTKNNSILLEAVAKEVYVKVKVLEYEDCTEAERRFGERLVHEHRTLLNKTYFIPRCYQGSVLRHYKTFYYSVSEILDDMPETVKLTKPFEIPTEGNLPRTKLSSGTVFTLTGLKLVKGDRILCCTHGDRGRTLSLNEHWTLCAKALSDGKLVSMDILAKQSLPQKVTFGVKQPSLTYASDQDDVNLLALVLSGPVEVLSCESIDTHICHTRDIVEEDSISTLLIPPVVAKQQRVFLPRSGARQGQQLFSDPVEKESWKGKLYIVNSESIEKTKCLRRGLVPNKFIRNTLVPEIPDRPITVPRHSGTVSLPGDSHVTQAQQTAQRRSEGNSYVELPTRAAQEKQLAFVKDYVKQVKRKCESGFDKVHAELRGWVSSRQTSKKTLDYTSTVTPSVTTDPSNSRTAHSQYATVGCTGQSGEDSLVDNTARSLPKHDQQTTPCHGSGGTGSDEDDNDDDDGYATIAADTVPHTSCESGFDKVHAEVRGWVSNRQTSKKTVDYTSTVTPSVTIDPGNSRTTHSQYVTVGCTGQSGEDSLFDNTARNLAKHDSGGTGSHAAAAAAADDDDVDDDGYATIAADTVPHTSSLTEEFFQYSVREVVACLQHCGFTQLSEICRSESLDGNFFRLSTNTMLTAEPFNMSEFEIKKFKRVIGGWRPKW